MKAIFYSFQPTLKLSHLERGVILHTYNKDQHAKGPNNHNLPPHRWGENEALRLAIVGRQKTQEKNTLDFEE
jgi:hypothetical protein